MKILFASSKEMNCSNLAEQANTININQVLDNIDFIKSINEKDSYHVFKTKENIYSQNQNINVLSKHAIKLFNGISFRQLDDFDNTKLNNVIILSALYGYSYAFDYISPFRYDYTMKNSKVNRKIIYQQLNNILSNEDIIYNLSSKEFSTGVIHENIIDFEFYLAVNDNLKQHSVASKKLRGQLLNYIIKNDEFDLTKFTFEGYHYDIKKSTKNKYVYIKKA